MKRIFCLILCASLLLCLNGCNSKNKEETIPFYYCRTAYEYGAEDAVIAAEQRQISPNTTDLKNLLALYLVGPLDETLISPFPGARLLSVETQGEELLIQLTDTAGTMTDARFSLACACMTMTCLDLTDASQVTIACGERSVTMSRDNLLLYDSIASTETTEETQ